MIRYPSLNEGTTIGVTAPSSGVKVELHGLLRLSFNRMEMQGFNVVCGETIWTQNKAKSSPAKVRAIELNKMMRDDQIGIIIPPWGGELLIEILEYLDFDNFKSKWILGYSDTSVLLLAITLKTGIATAHGTNLIDLRGDFSDNTTAMWQSVLSTKTGESIIQYSSEKYQKEWKHSDPSPCIFHLTEQTYWKAIQNTNIKIQGRLLGGCIDVIRHLFGTPFGDVQHFQKNHLNNEPVLWYLENCELSTTDLRRSLVQMKLAGWFDNCSGLLFGRSDANQPIDNYTAEDIYKELYEELQVPIIYDIDCGHVPPQMTFINGAYAEIEVKDGRGSVKQSFKH
ncbi:LD-carboxypeptidase [Paenibacillus sp. WQ 127069]|uniref:LD-carboxypeptidase n=1 Tax=Paenibacillus baimaensis TaxID=2982185 RepID=A0ABT2UGM4_9BACL|nr:S66 peptidase family protein [Paenibacillus sp. WQ 127069]MCU6793783.1 LD-carboxypeptidase [Paenibacillus sp. WQ 127069]